MVTRTRRRLTTALIAGIGCLAAPLSASADTIADFFRERQVNWIVSYGPGGSYGLYAQIAARHLPRHLPGKPTIVVQFMPGAGGITATNHLYNLAPKDGSVIATVTKDLALEQALRPKDVRYDARRFGWVGTFAEYIAVFAVWTDSGIKTIADARQRETILATSGRGHQGSQLAVALNEYAGTKFKLVAGYRGAADMNVDGAGRSTRADHIVERLQEPAGRLVEDLQSSHHHPRWRKATARSAERSPVQRTRDRP